MTDQADRLRVRTAAASGEVEDRARVLADGLRSGTRPLFEVQLLAYLADPAACLALGEAPPELPPDDRDAAVLWLRGFAAWGEETFGRAVVAWRWSGLEAEQRHDHGFLELVERWWAGAWPRDADPVYVLYSGAALSTMARELRDALHAVTDGDRAGTRRHIDEGVWAPASPAVIRPRLGAWITARDMYDIPAFEGEGPLVQRAIDHGTPAERRALVAYLRANPRGPVLWLHSRRVETLEVHRVGFELLRHMIDGGAVHGRYPHPTLLEEVAIPPGEGASPGAR